MLSVGQEATEARWGICEGNKIDSYGRDRETDLPDVVELQLLLAPVNMANG